MCECSTNDAMGLAPCDAPRSCQNITGQPPCSCFNETHCLDNADTCSGSTCTCSTNSPDYTVCDEGRICQDITGQPGCSCQPGFNGTDCLENADTCNGTTMPPSCECSTNGLNFSVCDTGRWCQDIPGQPACSCLTSSQCLENADTCTTFNATTPSTCECSTNGPNNTVCEEESICQDIPGQPGCSCQPGLNGTDCLENADTCNSNTSPPTCECSTNMPNFTVCDEGSLCQDIPGQPGCSCMNATQCLDNADTCNITSYPPSCECSTNWPDFIACDEASICQDIPGQPGCSCLNATSCLENADTCNSTAFPPICECSTNWPTFDVCEEGSACINITGQPPCSCQNATQCSENSGNKIK